MTFVIVLTYARTRSPQQPQPRNDSWNVSKPYFLIIQSDFGLFGLGFGLFDFDFDLDFDFVN